MRILFVIVCLISTASLAKKKSRHQHAHVHGAGKLTLAFDGLKGQVEFQVPASNILGYEYQPQTDVDKLILANATKTFQQDFSKMVQFDATLGCVITADKVGQKMEAEKSNHSDFEATYTVECKKSLLNSTVKINFSQYDQLNVDVTILVDKVQKKLKASGKESSVVIK